MPRATHSALVPAHIDGFLLQTDFRWSRFSAVGQPSTAAPHVAEQSRAELELTLVLRGRAQLLLADGHIQLEPQQMLFIRPREPHLVLDASEDFLAWAVVFKQRLVRRVCAAPGTHPLRARVGRGVLLRKLRRPDVEALSALYSGVPVGVGRDVFNAGLGYALTRSWLAYTRAPEELDATTVHPAVRAAAWILRGGEAGLSNAELAGRVGLSTHRLSRLFNRQMGTTLVDFRNRQRIHAVLTRIEAGERDLTGLAYDAGFGSYSQFHRAFRQRFGQSPSAYLRRRVVSG